MGWSYSIAWHSLESDPANPARKPRDTLTLLLVSDPYGMPITHLKVLFYFF